MDERQHHESMGGLMSLLTKVNRDLDLVQNRLEKEFHQIYPDGVRFFFPIFGVCHVCVFLKCVEILFSIWTCAG